MFIRRDIEWDFIDALAAVNFDTAVYQTLKERWRDVVRRVLGLNRTIRVWAGLTEMKWLGVAALQLMLTFGNKVHLAKMCAEGLQMFLWWTKTVLVGGMSTFLTWKVGLLKLPLRGVIWVPIPWLSRQIRLCYPGLQSSLKMRLAWLKEVPCALFGWLTFRLSSIWNFREQLKVKYNQITPTYSN